MKVKQVLNALEEFAPLPLQEEWDNSGLQVGLTEAEVSGALLCLEVTEEVMDEAAREGCNLIVSHHPLLFRPLKRITGADQVQRIVMRAIREGVAIISMHTNLDSAWGGVNWKTAEKLQLTDIQGIGERQTSGGVEGTQGVMGSMERPMTAEAFVAHVKQALGAESVMCNQLLQRQIRKVAVCCGAGDFLLAEAVRQGADAFVTGEMHYHQYFGCEQELQIVVAGHYQTEQYTSEIFNSIIREKCPGTRTVISQTRTNPIIYL